LNIIILTGRHGASRTVTLGAHWVAAGVSLLLTLPLVASLVTWQLLSGSGSAVADDRAVPAWQQALQEYEVEPLQEDDGTQAQIERMSQQLARLQMRLTRLDALGERVSGLAGIAPQDFDFRHRPARGGPAAPAQSTELTLPELRAELARLVQIAAYRAVGGSRCG